MVVKKKTLQCKINRLLLTVYLLYYLVSFVSLAIKKPSSIILFYLILHLQPDKDSFFVVVLVCTL